MTSAENNAGKTSAGITNAENFSAEDHRWMQRALELARAGVGLASPNPTVGCVIVKDGAIVGEGFHRYDERDHAEVAALRQAQENARGATAYVTLEPCSHTGRTGPCTEALIAAGVARVVAATLDPNPQVRGSSMARLQQTGMVAECGLLQAEARAINNAFAKFITSGLPFVTLKAALSREGFLAPAQDQRTPKQSYRLTGTAADAEVQRMRHAADAVLTGIATVLADDPLLTDRSGLPRRRALLRVVMDSALRSPLDANLVTTSRSDVMIFCGAQADAARQRTLELAGVAVLRCDGAQPQPADVLRALAQRGVTHVLLEAGAKMNAAFLSTNLVDALVIFHAPFDVGAGGVPFAADAPPAAVWEAKLLYARQENFGDDTCLRGLLRDPWQAVE